MLRPSERLAGARLYFISGDARRASPPRCAAGSTSFQLRDKGSGDDALLPRPPRRAGCATRAGALLMVNDRPDIAVAAGADGVHVGQDDMTARRGPRDRRAGSARRAVHAHARPDRRRVPRGRRLHRRRPGVRDARPRPGAPAVGPALVAYAARHATVPFFAIGGIDAGNAHEVVAAGARRIAVVRAIAAGGRPRGRCA